MDIQVWRGDITQTQVEAIVTAANIPLMGGGGVDGAIHRAAGPRLLAALRPLAPCQPGHAVVTDAFDLEPRIRWVVHAVGPRYGVDEPSADLLAEAYVAALARCDEVGAKSVAFPSISTGVYHYPLIEACQISIKALSEATTSVDNCQLVAFDDATEQAWTSALADFLGE
jgi:O-acetyl-ADP-ribose deacetylase